MSSNNYNAYNYPYHQQTSAQQYSSYQTAPASTTTPQLPRQYQQPPPAATNQSTDYLSYYTPSCGAQSSGYGAAQDNTWNGSSDSYGATRDNGSRAAEVLRNMSNTGYATTTTAPSQSSSTAKNATISHSAQYSTGRSPQVQAQKPHTSQTAYGQSQARPRSANTSSSRGAAGRGLSSPVTAPSYPSQRVQPQYPQQHPQQRTASPTQTQYSHDNATATARNATMATTGTSQQYADYSHRQLPSVDSSHTSHTVASPTSYTPRPPAPIVQPPPSNVPESYAGPSTTVDPTAVYDPWPEYQRQRASRDAARAEQERKDEEARKEKEQKEEQERRQKEAEEEARQARIAASQPPLKAGRAHGQQASNPVGAQSNNDEVTEALGAGAGTALEAEIRAMMAKMRELNGKDPQLLARIWEEERRAKAPKSPTSTKAAPQPAVVPPAQVPTPPIANQRKKTIPRDSSSAETRKPATPAPAQAVPARPQAPPVRPGAAGGNTIWPADKKTEFARAAAHYLAAKNPDRQLDAEQIIHMFNGNPSYIELCEQLEQSGFKLDRSVFAKSLLLAVPDVNSAHRKTTLQPIPPAAATKAPAPPAAMKRPAPSAVMRHPIATPAAPSPRYTPAATPSMNGSSYSPFVSNEPAAAPPIPVAEMIPIKPELKAPANKEEAARKRNLSDLIDLTQLDEEDDMGPPIKRSNTNSNYQHTPYTPYTPMSDAGNVNPPLFNNFPTASMPALPVNEPIPRPMPLPANELKIRAVVEPLDKKKALRRNTYNPATIARDVLLACGRHPSERQLNQHLDILKVNIPQISNESDLSTIKWNLIDPGNPPPGYFKDSVQDLTGGADDEDGSEDEDREREERGRSSSHAVGGESVKVQAPLPATTNPFIKQKRRGRPPRHSPPNATTPATPNRPTGSADMSASAPRPSGAAAGVGYSAFRSATQYGPDGQPLPKKKGRPVGWRKAIHGSAAAVSRPGMNGHTGSGNHHPMQPSTLRTEPIRIDSRSPSVANRIVQYQSFKCKWQNCSADLHNLETLTKHVFKVHKKETPQNTLECLWADCGKEIAGSDSMMNMSPERHAPREFGAENMWREHIQQSHTVPLAWEQGDGPAGGLSDAHDSEAYLSDAKGRRVTPRITADVERHGFGTLPPQPSVSALRGRGRPPKNTQEQDARETQDRLVSLKRRMGGPGMDRGGATLVNDKRRRGLIDSDGTEEELVDVED